MVPDKRNPNIPETAKNQKKLTQVLSPKQKLASVNQLNITQKFEKKVSFIHEKQKLIRREEEFQKQKWIEENKTALEAIEETKRVKTYFENDEQAIQFAHLIRD